MKYIGRDSGYIITNGEVAKEKNDENIVNSHGRVRAEREKKLKFSSLVMRRERSKILIMTRMAKGNKINKKQE